MPVNESRSWRQEPMVWMVIAIPAVAVLVGIVMLTISIRNFDGLVADDYYKQGLAINQKLQRQQQAAAHGLSAVITLLADQKTVIVTLKGNSNFQLPPSISFGMHHATRSDSDAVVELPINDKYQYAGSFPELAYGRWYVSVQTQTWRLSDVVQWPAENHMIKLGSKSNESS